MAFTETPSWPSRRTKRNNLFQVLSDRRKDLDDLRRAIPALTAVDRIGRNVVGFSRTDGFPFSGRNQLYGAPEHRAHLFMGMSMFGDCASPLKPKECHGHPFTMDDPHLDAGTGHSRSHVFEDEMIHRTFTVIFSYAFSVRRAPCTVLIFHRFCGRLRSP